MNVTTLIFTNFEEFDLDFTATFRRHNVIIGISLDNIPSPDAVSNYNVVLNTYEEKLNFCAILRGQTFNDDAETLYNLLFQYIGTSGTGSNTVFRHNRSKNGHTFYFELKGCSIPCIFDTARSSSLAVN